MKLYVLALLCISVRCMAQDEYYEVGPRKYHVALSVGPTMVRLPGFAFTQKDGIRPQFGLSYRFKYKGFTFEPELLYRVSNANFKTKRDAYPNCAVCYEQFFYRGSSFHLTLPLSLTHGKVGISMGPTVEIPFLKYTQMEFDTSFLTPPEPIKVAQWDLPSKLRFGFYLGLQYNLKRYQIRLMTITTPIFYDTFIAQPNIFGVMLGYRP